MKYVFVAIASLLIGLTVGGRQALANTYDVTAKVPFAVASVPATIDQSLNNAVVGSSQVEMNGTCQTLSPVSVVSIWRGGQLIGSVSCEANGTYRLKVSLQPGANTLIARTGNISTVYGPDSSPITITYTPAVASTTTRRTVPGSQASSNTRADNQLPATNPEVNRPSGLSITTTNPVEILNDNNQVSINVTVASGQSPYTVLVVWGDGTTETRTVPGPGTYMFTHTFQKKGIYKATATVTDVLGVSRTHQFLLTSAAPPTSGSTQTNNSGVTTDGTAWWSQYATFIIASILAVSVFGSGYIFGHYASRQPIDVSSGRLLHHHKRRVGKLKP